MDAMKGALTADPERQERECKGQAALVRLLRSRMDLALDGVDNHKPETMRKAEDAAMDLAVAIGDMRSLCAACSDCGG